MCLLGDNGAGKSTLIKTLAGVHKPTSGEFLVEGQPVTFARPRDALDAGIATVYQDLAMIPLMSVTRNFFMGREPMKGVWPVQLRRFRPLRRGHPRGDAPDRHRRARPQSGVSNHGGRQLDGAPSTIAALPKVADAIGGQKEILLDSGVRTGQDVFRALALGANACMIGRAFLYGLGAGGQAGVSQAIDIFRRELDTTMVLAGINDVKKIDYRAIASELPGEFAARN